MQSIKLKDYLDASTRPDNSIKGNVRAKTAAYQIAEYGDCGDIFTNAGAAGSVTFTLPTAKNGRVVRFMKVANQTFVVKAAANSAGATSAKINGSAANGTLTNSTAGELLKALEVFSDGVDWFVAYSTGTWA